LTFTFNWYIDIHVIGYALSVILIIFLKHNLFQTVYCILTMKAKQEEHFTYDSFMFKDYIIYIEL